MTMTWERGAWRYEGTWQHAGRWERGVGWFRGWCHGGVV